MARLSIVRLLSFYSWGFDSLFVLGYCWIYSFVCFGGPGMWGGGHNAWLHLSFAVLAIMLRLLSGCGVCVECRAGRLFGGAVAARVLLASGNAAAGILANLRFEKST